MRLKDIESFLPPTVITTSRSNNNQMLNSSQESIIQIYALNIGSTLMKNLNQISATTTNGTQNIRLKISNNKVISRSNKQTH